MNVKVLLYDVSLSAFHLFSPGKELRTVGYNYPLKLLVSNAGKQMVVEAIVATTTYRDQYRWVIP